MSKKFLGQLPAERLQKIRRIRQALEGFELVCSGTLLERRKVCGKTGCRCMSDPAARHGPYYEWTRRYKGKLLHRVVTAEQANLIRQAIANYRAILRLLRRWERETTRFVEGLRSPKR
jgi:hypothetical protein